MRRATKVRDLPCLFVFAMKTVLKLRMALILHSPTMPAREKSTDVRTLRPAINFHRGIINLSPLEHRKSG
jgi:hypothetical protein